MTSRPLEIPRLTEGTRVRYDFGKWSCCANSVRHDPAWAAADWAYSYTGTVVPITEHRGHIYPPHHPWGVPRWLYNRWPWCGVVQMTNADSSESRA